MNRFKCFCLMIFLFEGMYLATRMAVIPIPIKERLSRWRSSNLKMEHWKQSGMSLLIFGYPI
ncbi:MAG: hypothetical protein ABIS01_03770 [Ferruginibacter sp.]